jgi:dimethylglycine dehydrogenase
MGPSLAAPNFFHCCAFTFGIVQAGGAGRAIAEWVVNGEPDWDLWPLDHRRYLAFADREYTRAKALETYGNEYGIGYPCEERPAGRPAKSSPLYGELKRAGAVFGARGGWERAVYFRAPGDPGGPEASFRRPHWHGAVQRECATVANGVALLDLPGFTRFAVRGAGAAGFLDRLIAGALPRPGRTSLAYACSPRGGIVMEMTLTHLPDGTFWLLSAAAAQRHDADWLHHHPGAAIGRVEIVNHTGGYGTLVLAGPGSRELLGRVTDADFGTAAFPWLAARTLAIAGVPVLALRVSYVGELGFELHLAVEQLAAVYARLTEAGRELQLGHLGLYAVESLRLEKCYRSWKADLTREYTPLEASLGRFVRLDKAADFVGREALRRQAAAGVTQRFVPLLVDAGDADAAPVSIVWRGGERVGLITSGGYGYRLGRSIALGYVRCDLTAPGTELEIEILGERRRALVGLEPLYDPDNVRLRA